MAVHLQVQPAPFLFPTSSLSSSRRDHIVCQYKAVEKLLTSHTPRRGTNSQLQKRRYKKRGKNPTWNSYLPFIICFFTSVALSYIC